MASPGWVRFPAGLARVGCRFGAFEADRCLHSAIPRRLANLGVRRDVALGLARVGCGFGFLEANRLLDSIAVGMLGWWLSAAQAAVKPTSIVTFSTPFITASTPLSCSLFAKESQIVDMGARAKRCTRPSRKKYLGKNYLAVPYRGSKL